MEVVDKEIMYKNRLSFTTVANDEEAVITVKKYKTVKNKHKRGG
jgi:hypothetical protein